MKARRDTGARAIVEEPMLLIFNEKHGNRYFEIANDEALFKAALKIVTERLKAGYWYEKPRACPKALDYTLAEIVSMPKSLQPQAEKALRVYEGELAAHNDEVEEYTKIERAVAEKNGRIAYEILRSREDAEYEGFELKRLERA